MTRSKLPMKAVVKELCHLAEKAGHEAMRFYGGRSSVVLKSDSSPLTDANRASHDLLMQFLPDLIPGIPAISEEAEASTRNSTHGADRFWLADPLDGTKEFLDANLPTSKPS